jgi:hypothetical protein
LRQCGTKYIYIKIDQFFITLMQWNYKSFFLYILTSNNNNALTLLHKIS